MELPQEAKERLAMLEIDQIRERGSHDRILENEPEDAWHWIPGLLGMPVEHDAEPLRSLPWVTWGVAAIIVVLSLLSFSDLQGVVNNYGLVPAELGRHFGLTFLSSFFLHGGVWHLVGNVYFLLVFGDNAEDWLGKGRFLLLVVCAAFVGDIVHILGDPRSTTPCIGASGGISGILAFYALKFPKVKIGFLFRFAFLFRWCRVSAQAMFTFWLIMQAFGTWAQIAGFSNVSSLAHLGGVAVGFIFWFLTKRL
jgi:membrane associated rhomboid family serine protease